jgi:hypothetical protein
MVSAARLFVIEFGESTWDVASPSQLHWELLNRAAPGKAPLQISGDREPIGGASLLEQRIVRAGSAGTSDAKRLQIKHLLRTRVRGCLGHQDIVVLADDFNARKC